ncbi:unnamed protein product, partial [Brenthis ino]
MVVLGPFHGHQISSKSILITKGNENPISLFYRHLCFPLAGFGYAKIDWLHKTSDLQKSCQQIQVQLVIDQPSHLLHLCEEHCASGNPAGRKAKRYTGKRPISASWLSASALRRDVLLGFSG